MSKQPFRGQRQWRRTRSPPQKKDVPHYRQIWRIVDGAVADAMASHPDYFANRAARASVCKRVVGSLCGYLAQAEKGGSG